MGKYQLVIFDWEGTLGDSVASILADLKTVVAKVGLSPFNLKQARQLISGDFYTMLQDLYPELASHEILALQGKFRQYHLRAKEEPRLYLGAKAMLNRLSKQKKLLAIATSKNEIDLNDALLSTGIEPLFFALRTPQQCACKPAPDMVLEIIELSGLKKEEVVVVGDSRCDMEMATHAGVAAIGLNVSKLASIEALMSAGAQAVVSNYRELEKRL